MRERRIHNASMMLRKDGKEKEDKQDKVRRRTNKEETQHKKGVEEDLDKKDEWVIPLRESKDNEEDGRGKKKQNNDERNVRERGDREGEGGTMKQRC